MNWGRKHKYNVSPPEERTVDGIKFDSKKEAKRYVELKRLEESGEISGLKLQPPFEIAVNGIKIGIYKADFWYDTPEGSVVEDVKGTRTPLYKFKKKLVEAIYGFEITET